MLKTKTAVKTIAKTIVKTTLQTKPKVLLTRQWPAEVESALAEDFNLTLNPLDKALSAQQLSAAFTEYDALCPCVTDAISAELVCQATLKVKIIANYGVGFNHIDLTAMENYGIQVTNTPDVLTHATADLAMTLMLMVARRAGEGERQVRNQRWHGWFPTHSMGTMITGKTLGIIGMGRIGRAMAQKAHHGFGMKILYHNRSPIGENTMAAEFCPDLVSLLAESDFVALHCPGGAETRHIMNAGTFSQMKPEAFLINTARGDVVDETALIAALQAGTIAGAGLDVFAQEPVVPFALQNLENVVLLPHLGSATLETRTAMGMRVKDNLLAFFNGDTPPDLL